jgi:hypothetical protein
MQQLKVASILGLWFSHVFYVFEIRDNNPFAGDSKLHSYRAILEYYK